MTWTRALRRLWFIVTGRRRADDLAAELEFHRQMKADELRASGVDEVEVRAATQKALGNDLLARERARDVWVAPWLQDVTQDLRFGLRMLIKERRFALAATVTLGLGIAVSNAAFAFANAAMFRDLPFAQPDRLLTIRTHDTRGFMAGVSYLEFREWQRHTTVFEALSADISQSVNVTDGTRVPERLSGTFLTHETFRTLGVAPILGRDFVAADEREGAPPVAMLSHGLWQSRYGGDPAIIGRVIRVNDQPATVIGVMPERFNYPLVADLWVPIWMAPGLRNIPWTSTAFTTVGRLKPGATLEQARIEVETIGARTLADRPEMNKDRKLAVMGVKESQLANGGSSLMWALLGAAVIVLLVASANVANLLLARSWQRSREIAVRMAMGASRWRVIRQVLIEAGLIGAGGGVLGMYLSWVAFQVMASAFNVLEFGAPDRPRKPYWFDPSIDGAGWMFLGAAFLLASLGAGLLPALHLSKTDVNDVLKDGRAGEATRASRRWAASLMVAQIAVALMLLTGAGLFARNFLALYHTDPVIDVEGLVTMRMTISPKYATAEQRLQFVRQLDERLAANREFAQAAIGDMPLQTFTMLPRFVRLEGEVLDPNLPRRSAVYVAAGPRFFETFKFPVPRGRALLPQDERPGRESAVVNQRFAALFFGDADPIGQRIQLSQPGPAPVPPPAWLTIVGIVPTIPDFLPNRPDDAMVVAPLLGDPTPSRVLGVTVRSGSKAAAAAALREEVARLDAELPIYAIQTLDEVLAMSRMGARMVGSWFQTLALVAVVLAAVGLYALIAHGVAQRRREIGVRIALGATATQVLWLFLRQTLVLLAIGMAIGMAGALATSRMLAAFLGDIDPRDPVTLLAVATVIAAIAVIAGLAPARRATRVDAAVALRVE